MIYFRALSRAVLLASLLIAFEANKVTLSDEVPLQAKILQPLKIPLESKQGKGDEVASIVQDVWRAEFAALYKRRVDLSKKTGRSPLANTEVFAVVFDVPEGRLVLSATATPDRDCSSYQAIGLSPNLITCPMRVGLVIKGVVKVIYSNEVFPFSLARNENGVVEGPDQPGQTMVTFDRPTKTIKTELYHGEPQIASATVQNDNRLVKLDY